MNKIHRQKKMCPKLLSGRVLNICRWFASGGRSAHMNAARLLCVIIHGWSAIQDNEASHLCHTNTCLDERHVVPESVLLNAERERCRKGWQVCEHILTCTTASRWLSGWLRQASALTANSCRVLEEIAELLDDDNDDPDDDDSDDDDRDDDKSPMRV